MQSCACGPPRCDLPENLPVDITATRLDILLRCSEELVELPRGHSPLWLNILLPKGSRTLTYRDTILITASGIGEQGWSPLRFARDAGA